MQGVTRASLTHLSDSDYIARRESYHNFIRIAPACYFRRSLIRSFPWKMFLSCDCVVAVAQLSPTVLCFRPAGTYLNPRPFFCSYIGHGPVHLLWFLPFVCASRPNHEVLSSGSEFPCLQSAAGHPRGCPTAHCDSIHSGLLSRDGSQLEYSTAVTGLGTGRNLGRGIAGHHTCSYMCDGS